jgi:hypothetical protein
MAIPIVAEIFFEYLAILWKENLNPGQLNIDLKTDPPFVVNLTPTFD